MTGSATLRIKVGDTCWRSEIEPTKKPDLLEGKSKSTRPRPAALRMRVTAVCLHGAHGGDGTFSVDFRFAEIQLKRVLDSSLPVV
jgi:hypothetical protein